MESKSDNKAFLAGSIPLPAPNGSYKVTWAGVSSWTGKDIDSTNSSGVNLIDSAKRCPFDTS